MAQKRMFSLSVVDTDKFLEMPLSSRLLYYELGMRADDDGFVDNWKKILLFTGLKEDDIKVLIAKSFIIPFDSGIIVIKHWRMNNYLQNDRIKPTVHQEELSQLELDNGEYILSSDKYIEEHQNFIGLNWEDKRKLAYENSELPYSFDYKIRKAFKNKPCPICGCEMKEYVNAPHRPTIQHNIPISKGGKHELGNISVICHKCNVSIRDNETEELNAKEVIKEWDKINSCIQPCIHSIDKNSIDKNIYIQEKSETKKISNKESYGKYNRVKLKPEEYTKLVEDFGEDFIKTQIDLLDEYVESNNNKNKYTNFNLVLRRSIRENWFKNKKIENKTNNPFLDMVKEEYCGR